MNAAAELERLSSIETASCVLWPYALSSHGYGSLRVNGASVGAHREVCKRRHGPPPSSAHEAAHRCGIRACVNPRHIRWATPRENTGDRRLHGTELLGERRPNAKLSEAAVQRIRRLYAAGGVSQAALAERYGVNQTAVGKVVRGDAWAHVPSMRAGRQAGTP